MMMLEEDSQQDSDLYKQLEVMKQDSLSAIKEKAALRDKGSVVTGKQAELQEAEITQYEDTYKKAFFNSRRKENTGLGIESEVAEGAIADELARLKQRY
jgi:hypothetical protein